MVGPRLFQIAERARPNRVALSVGA